LPKNPSAFLQGHVPPHLLPDMHKQYGHQKNAKNGILLLVME
jgi:hypothetical protein